MGRLIRSVSHDPGDNLALEETLLRSGPEDGETWLYLWRNRPTVVIGRNQNPYLECHPEELNARGIQVVRRLSGGGAVYHDLGNLNYTFLCREDRMDVERQTGVIREAVRALGLDCEFSGRNDLLCQGKKFSGQAFYAENGSAYHHGTLMVDVDLETMEQALTPSAVKLETKSVASVRQRVVNLHTLLPSITVERAAAALEEQFCLEYGGAETEYLNAEACPQELRERYHDPAWNLGSCPRYDAALDVRTAQGTFQLRAEVVRGTIRSVVLSSDALEPLELSGLEQALIGCPFLAERVRETLEQAMCGQRPDDI